MGVAVYSLDGYEGDDILGTLSLRYEKEMPVNIVTGDRDALQLSSSRTTVFLTQKGITNMAAMTPEAVFEKYHIEPRQVIDMKALMGDTADNIPGVPGIGEKTALKLITQYDNLNNLYAHVEEIKGAQGKKLTANKELAYLSYDLATIKRDVPLETSLEEMHQPVHFEEMRVLFQKLGINLLQQFADLPRFRALAEAKKEKSQRELVKAEPWQGEAFDEKIAALLIDRSGIAPFFTARSAVVVSEGRAYTAVPAQYEKLAEASRKRKRW